MKMMQDNNNTNNMLMHGFILVTILATAKSAEAEITMEAAFQGHCGHTSPCEQLCYEIHDGMYECDCIEGYELNKNGYSCQVINSTSSSDGHSKSDEDVLYQKGASFSAKLANDNENQLLAGGGDGVMASTSSLSSADAASSSSSAASGSDEDIDDSDLFFNDDLQQQLSTKQKVNSKDYYISAESINYSNNKPTVYNANNFNDVPEFAANRAEILRKQQQEQQQQQQPERQQQVEQRINRSTVKPIYVTNNGNFVHNQYRQIVLSHIKTTSNGAGGRTGGGGGGATAMTRTTAASTTAATANSASSRSSSNTQAILKSNVDEDDYYLKQDMSIYDDVNNNQLNLRPLNPSTYQDQNAYNFDSKTLSIMKDNQNQYGDIDATTMNNEASSSLTRGAGAGAPLTRQYAAATGKTSYTNISNMTTSGSSSASTGSGPCSVDCGTDGQCDNSDGKSRCLCPFGKAGNNCMEELKVRVPKFSKKSWLAFPALRGAYKHVQIRIEFRPETFNGIILLSGERDDLTGDFMALLLNKGFVEFWFDCGSGVGSVRSKETILLNEWNSVIIYRHRWDAWLVLNHGTRVQGRSNGLFSRITFREPVFLGGTGNITGLAKRLPINDGFVGCIRRFVANEHEYKFEEHPLGDVTKGFDIQDCVTDKCFKYPCQHGGKCLPSDQGAVCLCPIGFVGDLCEIRMDLQVPAFNGSSFLRYAPLGDSALIWLELKIILKPEHTDGIILYSGPESQGDFIALSLSNGYVEFAFELGSGPALVRSEHPLSIGQWHTIKVSRTARLAVLKVDNTPEVMTISSNGFWHLSLPYNLYLGGVKHMDNLPLDLKYKPYFAGCIQKVDINGHALSIVSEALGGTNIGNCPHACVARPCGPLAQCIPQMENYECRCSVYSAQCNKAAEVPMEELQINKAKNRRKTAVEAATGTKRHLETVQKIKKIKAYQQAKQHAKVQNKLMLKESAAATITKPLSSRTSTTKLPTTTTTTTEPLPTLAIEIQHPEDFTDDDIIFRDVHAMHRKHGHNEKTQQQHQQQRNLEIIQRNPKMKYISKHQGKGEPHHQHQHEHPHQYYARAPKHDPYHKHISGGGIESKLSRLPTHYESFQTNPESDILTFDNIELETPSSNEESFENASEEQYESFADDTMEHYENDHPHEHDHLEDFVEPYGEMDKALFGDDDQTDDAHKKQFVQDMKRIMGNTHTHSTKIATEQDQPAKMPSFTTVEDVQEQFQNENVNNHDEDISDEDLDDDNDDLLEPVVESTDEKPNTQTQTDWSVLKRFDLTGIDNHQIGVKKNFGACFAGSDSYFHYNDAETMSQIISYNIDLNLRIKTHSSNGVILWTGRQATNEEDDDFLSLGIEDGYLHFRYDLGSGEVDIRFNMTKVSDGLWHRVRAIRDSQDGYLEVDGRKSPTQHSPGKLRQLNTDTGLYVGGMPDASYFTRRKYDSGIVGCISEIVLAGELKLNFDPNTLGTAHNVETGIL